MIGKSVLCPHQDATLPPGSGSARPARDWDAGGGVKVSECAGSVCSFFTWTVHNTRIFLNDRKLVSGYTSAVLGKQFKFCSISRCVIKKLVSPVSEFGFLCDLADWSAKGIFRTGLCFCC